MGRHMSMFADKKRTRSSRVLIGILWGYLSNYTHYMVFIALITLFYTAAVTFQPIIIQSAIDMLIGGLDASGLVLLVVVYFALALISWVSQSMNTWLMATLQSQLVHSLRTSTFESLVNADMSYLNAQQSGDTTSRVINDTTAITSGLQVFTTSLTNILVAVTTLIVLFTISVWFGLIALLAIPMAFVITKVISTRGKAKMLEVRSSMGRVSGKLAENLAGVAIAKAFNQEKRTSKEIRELNQTTYIHFKQLGMLFTFIFPSITFISIIMLAAIVWTGGTLYVSAAIGIGKIYLGTIFVRRFLSPILSLANNITNLQTSLAALDRVTDIIQSKPAISNSPDAQPLQLKHGEIVLSGVSFAYTKRSGNKNKEYAGKAVKHKEKGIDKDNKRSEETGDDILVLEDVSLTIPAGKKTAIIGHTGAGKTTITKLLLRYYDPKEGSITIDGQDIRDVKLESLYNNISFVSQEPYLFASTVLENIKYGKIDATDEEVYSICKMIGADVFIDVMHDGYKTKLDEGGKSLSAGQRQMITIARTMLSDPHILILDEATSRLDSYTESLVQIAQNQLFEDRTSLIIAHRLSTIRNVDRIIVLDAGKVVEVGNHDELMKLQGMYYSLYRTYYAHQGLETIEPRVEN